MQRRHFLRTATCLSSAAALLPASSWAQTGKKELVPVKFTLDFKVTSQTSPFFLAASKGYYAAEGLDVQIDVGAGSVASITRVASGAYDMGLGDISSLIEAHASGTMPCRPSTSTTTAHPSPSLAARTRASPPALPASKARKWRRLPLRRHAAAGPWWPISKSWQSLSLTG